MREELECDVGEDFYGLGSRLLQEGGGRGLSLEGNREEQ